MALKQTTMALVGVAVLLGGVVYWTQFQDNSTAETDTPASDASTDLFDFEESQVNALTVTTPLRSLQFEKTTAGEWQMTDPDTEPANDATIAYLLNLLATGQSARTLIVPAGDRTQFGLHQPFGEVDVTLDNQTTHQFILGEYDFNRQFIYAQTDPTQESADTMEVMLVSPDFENAINRPLDDWKQPPNPPPPSPSLTPDPTESAP